MATPGLTGRLGTIYSSTTLASTATSSQTKWLGLQDYTLTVDRDTIDITNHDSSGYHENLSGIMKWTGESKVIYMSTAAGQGALRAFLVGTNPGLVNITLAQTTSKTTAKYQGKCRITGFSASHGTDAAILGTLKWTGSGPLVRTA